MPLKATQAQSATWFDQLMIRAGSESPIRAELGWDYQPLHVTVGTVQWYRKGRPKVYEYFGGVGQRALLPGGLALSGDIFASYAQDSWYLQGWLGASLKSERTELFARGGLYEPLEDPGIRQLVLEESGLIVRLTDVIEVGASGVAHRYRGEHVAWAIGPSLRLTWPDGRSSLNVEYLKRRDNLARSEADPDFRVTYRIQSH